MSDKLTAEKVLQRIDELRSQAGEGFRDEMVTEMYVAAKKISDKVVTVGERPRLMLDYKIDRIVTHPVWGLPIMIGLLALVFWLTVAGANVPSALLAGLLIEDGGLTAWFNEYIGVQAPAFLTMSLSELLHAGFNFVGAPVWLTGFVVDGVYLALAWVVSVMLPPMAIFFPMFTLLEDLGYLPRVAFNLDWLFKRAGAHGKQSLTMAMGFGCNAAGITACRVIDSPREKLIAVLTNNFVPCNGRFPTLIALATLFVAAGFAPAYTSFIAAGTVMAVVLLGVIFTLVISWTLSRTLLQGEASAFTLELPPYRRPSVLRVLYTSFIDRTIFVLARACVVAAPAGAVLWLIGNITIGDATLATHVATFLDPFGRMMGLDGIIILAFIVAIPANEIVMPTILMLYLQRSMMFEEEGATLAVMLQEQGWTLLTAVCLMLFSLLHNPCGTAIWTMWKETRSAKWTAFGALMPIAIGIVVCTIVATVARMIA